MAISVGVGGVWKTMNNLSVGVGGVWKQVQKVSVGVGGVWKDAWTYLTVSLLTPINGTNTEISPTNSTTTLAVNNTGGYTATGWGGATWLTAGTASQCDVRLTPSVGSFAGSATSTWLNLGTSRSWSVTESRDGYYTTTATGTLEIRNATTLAVLATASVSLEAVVEI